MTDDTEDLDDTDDQDIPDVRNDPVPDDTDEGVEQ